MVWMSVSEYGSSQLAVIISGQTLKYQRSQVSKPAMLAVFVHTLVCTPVVRRACVRELYDTSQMGVLRQLCTQ